MLCIKSAVMSLALLVGSSFYCRTASATIVATNPTNTADLNKLLDSLETCTDCLVEPTAKAMIKTLRSVSKATFEVRVKFQLQLGDNARFNVADYGALIRFNPTIHHIDEDCTDITPAEALAHELLHAFRAYVSVETYENGQTDCAGEIATSTLANSFHRCFGTCQRTSYSNCNPMMFPLPPTCACDPFGKNGTAVCQTGAICCNGGCFLPDWVRGCGTCGHDCLAYSPLAQCSGSVAVGYQCFCPDGANLPKPCG